MDKTFLYCGTAQHKDGTVKVRMVNSKTACRNMSKANTNVIMVKLPDHMEEMTATKFISTLPEFQSDEQQTAINNFLNGIIPENKEDLPVEEGGIPTEKPVIKNVPKTKKQPNEKAKKKVKDIQDTVIPTIDEIKATQINEAVDTIIEALEDQPF